MAQTKNLFDMGQLSPAQVMRIPHRCDVRTVVSILSDLDRRFQNPWRFYLGGSNFLFRLEGLNKHNFQELPRQIF